MHTCDAEDNAPERLPAAPLIAQEETEPVIRPEGLKDGGAVGGDIVKAHHSVEGEPDQDDWGEEGAHKLGAKLLDEEQGRQDNDGDDHDPDCASFTHKTQQPSEHP